MPLPLQGRNFSRTFSVGIFTVLLRKKVRCSDKELRRCKTKRLDGLFRNCLGAWLGFFRREADDDAVPIEFIAKLGEQPWYDQQVERRP